MRYHKLLVVSLSFFVLFGAKLCLSWHPSKSSQNEDVFVQIEKLGGVVDRPTQGNYVRIHFNTANEDPEKPNGLTTSSIAQALKLLSHISDQTTISLSLEGSGIVDELFSHVGDLKRLCDLDISNTLITDNGLARLKNLRDLCRLSLTKNKIIGLGFEHLKANQRLGTLTIYDDKITDAGMLAIGKLSSLSKLELSFLDITDVGLTHLDGLVNLSELSLYQNNLNGTGLVALASLIKFRTLYITEDLSNEGMRALKTLKNLEKLSMCYMNMKDKSFVCMGDLYNLNILIITNNDGFANGVGDNCLGYFSSLGHLQKLELSGPRITDAGLMHLDNLQELKSLRLHNTMVTRQGAMKIKKRLPSLRIELIY